MKVFYFQISMWKSISDSINEFWTWTFELPHLRSLILTHTFAHLPSLHLPPSYTLSLIQNTQLVPFILTSPSPFQPPLSPSLPLASLLLPSLSPPYFFVPPLNLRIRMIRMSANRTDMMMPMMIPTTVPATEAPLLPDDTGGTPIKNDV